jgi:hypothetical protein
MRRAQATFEIPDRFHRHADLISKLAGDDETAERLDKLLCFNHGEILRIDAPRDTASATSPSAK